MFLKKGADKEGYDKFLSLVLFPSTTGVPDFGVVNKKGSSSVTYLFYNRSEALEFMDKYNSFIDLLTKVSNYSKKLGEEAFSNCRQFNSSKGNISGKDLFMYFRNTEDMKYCNFFNYYYSLVQGRINYALTDAPLDNYVPFIVDFLDSNVEKVKLVLAPVTEESKNKIKIAKESSFNKKKIIKYAAILFSISFVLSIFMVFIMEFWRNNRVRLSRYWRG